MNTAPAVPASNDGKVLLGSATVLIGGIQYGRLAGMWSSLLNVRQNLVAFLIYCVGAMAIFTSLRQLDELVLQTYPLLAWFAIAPFILKRQDAASGPAT